MARTPPTPAADPAPRGKKKAGTGRGAVALAAQALAEATSQLRTALSNELAKELSDAGAEVGHKVASSLQDAARALDEAAAKVAPTGKALRTREELLAAAARVFAAKGYEGASVGEIAEAAGYTKGALYAHFGSKEQLFMALARHYVHLGISEAYQADTGDVPFVDWLCASLPAALQDDLSSHYIMLNQEFVLFGLRHPEYRREMADLAAASRDALARRLAADRTGTPVDPDAPIDAEDLAAAMGIGSVSNDVVILHMLGVPGTDLGIATRLLRRIARKE